ncbi:hypothetical protein COO60DRAFT_838108 [Scenedesmus sp. NREL 46B-D3]|nr:hypothetical protein COO60DRAFT_838108 [Scenedesmus sp. NREL 46B-D3]
MPRQETAAMVQQHSHSTHTVWAGARLYMSAHSTRPRGAPGHQTPTTCEPVQAMRTMALHTPCRQLGCKSESGARAKQAQGPRRVPMPPRALHACIPLQRCSTLMASQAVCALPHSHQHSRCPASAHRSSPSQLQHSQHATNADDDNTCKVMTAGQQRQSLAADPSRSARQPTNSARTHIMGAQSPPPSPRAAQQAQPICKQLSASQIDTALAAVAAGQSAPAEVHVVATTRPRCTLFIRVT